MITIKAAPNFSTTISAGTCSLMSSAVKFFGTCLLEITNTAAVRTAIQGVTPNLVTSGDGAMRVYGPTNHFSLAPGSTIPIGVMFTRMSQSFTSVKFNLTVKFLDEGKTISDTAIIPIICDISNSPAFFVPCVEQVTTGFVFGEPLELVGCAQNKMIQFFLLCQQRIMFTAQRRFYDTDTHDFSATTPIGTFLQGEKPALTLSYDAAANGYGYGSKTSPEVVTVTAAGQSVPFICWVAKTPHPGKLHITQINADPPGRDLPNEFVTVQNVAHHTVDMGGCLLRDEAGAGSTFTFPNECTLSPDASVKVHTAVGQNTATDLFWGLPKPVWDNDFDTAVLYNFAGDEITRFSYMFAPEGMAIPGQTVAFDLTVPVPKSAQFTETGLTLEDGDLVVLDPDPNSTIWTGDLLHGYFGPAGHSGDIAPEEGGWPFPGAPRFALLATAGGRVVLVGGTRFSQVVDRKSSFRPNTKLQLLINDANPGAFGTGGFYVCRVRIFRK